MFGILKKKLSKAIKSISRKAEKKEDEIEKKDYRKDILDTETPSIEIEDKKDETEKIEPVVDSARETEISEPVVEKEKGKSLIKSALRKVTKRITETQLEEKDLDPILGELETDLIESDVAVVTAEKIKENLREKLIGKNIKRGKEEEAVVDALKKSILDILSVPEIDLKEKIKEKRPLTLLFVGFNGAGKTTSIAKVAKWSKENGMTCVLAAADTFRAASIEQLEEHAEKIGVKVVKHKYGADPAAVVYDAVEHAKSKDLDFVLADSAGRVHTNENLMKELKKIVRVNKPDLKILVIDSLTGNDALSQAKTFGEIGIDAVIFTKLDVNEKGGSILSVTSELKKPILFLSLGQEYDEFERFNPNKFIDSIFE